MRSKTSLISIIIPIYNIATYLPRCLDSVCKQTYPNLEIILIDDGSADNSLEICQQYAQKDARIRVFHQENKGVSAARNLGLKKTSGEFITFIDGDDWVVPHYVQCLFDLIEEYKTDIAIGGVVNATSSSSLVFPNGSHSRGIIRQEDAFFNPPHNTSINIASKLYRKSVLEGLIFNTNCSLGEDQLFFFHALQKAEVVASTDQKLYVYCRRENSAIPLSPIQTAYSDFKTAEKITQFSQSHCSQTVQKAALDATFSNAVLFSFLLLTTSYSDNKNTAQLHQMLNFFTKHRHAVWPCSAIGLPGKIFISIFRIFPKTTAFLCRIPFVKNSLVKIVRKHLSSKKKKSL